MITINAVGMRQIAEAIQTHGAKHLLTTPDALSAWASEAEESYCAGNSAQFEIGVHESRTGVPIVVTISQDGYDTPYAAPTRAVAERIVRDQDFDAANSLAGCDHGAPVDHAQAEMLAGDYICAALDGSILAWADRSDGPGRKLTLIEKSAP